MDLVRFAIEVAEKYYDEKTLKHALRVGNYSTTAPMACDFDRDFLLALGIMHDLIEDTDFKIDCCEALKNEKRFVECLYLLTKGENDSYKQYITRIRCAADDYPEAWIVKMADMKDHLSQKETLSDYLKEKYLNALPILL